MGFMHHNPGRIGHHADRTEMDFMFLMLGNLLQGFLLAYIFVKAGASSLIGGLTTGAIVGFLYAAGVDCIMYGTTYMVSKKGMMADVLAFMVISALVGAVLSKVISSDKN